MIVRRARRNELTALSAIEAGVFQDAVYPSFFFRQAFDLWPELLWIAAGADDEPRGYAMGAVSNSAGVAWILSMAVSKPIRSKGYGKALVAALLDAMRACGCTEVRLTVHPENAAIRIYERLGFHEISREADYFHSDDPRIVMQCRLAGR